VSEAKGCTMSERGERMNWSIAWRREEAEGSGITKNVV
jgi:hypothetical protein